MRAALVALAFVAAAHAAPADRVLSTEFTYLGDLLPIHTQATGYAPFQLNENWYGAGFNQFVMEGGNKVVKHFDHGVFTHAPANVHYHIEGKYAAFSACVGLDAYAGQNVASCNNHDGVQFRVKADGQVIWQTTKHMGEPQTCFQISLEVLDPSKNAQTLELDVDKLDNADCDEAEWVDAKLYEDPVVDCQQLGSLVPSFHSVGWGSYWVNRRWHENGFEIAGTRFTNGVFAHAPSHLIYPLHGKFDTFSSCVGLDDGVVGDSSQDCGRVGFKVKVDGQLQQLTDVGPVAGDAAAASTVIVKEGLDPVSCFTVQVTGAQHLELIVDEFQDSSCDESEWVNANVCREEPQAIDCQMNDWGDFNTCSRSCGTGYQKRSRTRKQAAQWGGKDCPAYEQTRGCSVESCPIDCQESTWSDWVTCSKTCGGGHKFRYRSESRSAAFGGEECGDLSEKMACGTQACPIDCQVSEWGPWGECSKECGGGFQWQNRTVLVDEDHDGRACPGLDQKRSCNTHNCAIDCGMTPWGDWDDCSVECGGGTQSRRREQSRLAQHGGKGCPASQEDRACNIAKCPIDCELSDWGDWPECSATCGTGRRTRYRSIEVTAAFEGEPCGNLTQTQTCNENSCPIDCLMGPWNPWETCNAECGGGVESRSRSVMVEPLNGGKNCSARTEDRPCNLHACPIDCQDNGFGSWSVCTKSCGADGTQVRHRNVIQGQFGGTECPANLKVGGADMMQSQGCNIQDCPRDCVITDWTPWSTCDAECGGGTMFRTRADTAMPAFGGKACPGLRQERNCNTQACPQDCSFSPFTPYNMCTKSCGGGSQTRTRVVTQQAAHGGVCTDSYGGTSETRACNLQPCQQDCQVSQWGSVSACSRTCLKPGQTAYEFRTRTIRRTPTNGGAACPDLKEERPCTTTPPTCVIDCEWGAWGTWSDTCSEDCGGGVKTATRQHKDPNYNGAACVGSATKTKPCNQQPCPITCVVTDWAAWNPCSRSCGEGITSRKRQNAILDGLGSSVYGANGLGPNGGVLVNQCPEATQTTTCNLHDCPVDCAVTQWNSWTTCSKECESGFTQRTRDLVTPPSNGGAACPSEMKQVKFCNEHPCMDTSAASYTWAPYVEEEKTAYVSEAAAAKLAAYQQRMQMENSATTAAATTTVVSEAVMWTTAAPKAACDWGQDAEGNTVTKPDGWSGAGSGNQFCNLLTCDDGTMVGEDVRDCTAPFKMLGGECPTLTCEFDFSYPANYPVEPAQEVLKITHQNSASASELSHHHCAYNLATSSCMCRCYDTDTVDRPVILQWSQE